MSDKEPIGKYGTFVDFAGETHACLVTGFCPDPFDSSLLVIDYVLKGVKISGAMIGKDSFIPDP